MQIRYLDVTAEQIAHNHVLRSYIREAEVKQGAEVYYTRISLQNFSAEEIKQLLVQVIIEESVHWVLQKKHSTWHKEFTGTAFFYEALQDRVSKIYSQLELLVCRDIDSFCQKETEYAKAFWNLEGYLRFAAKKLKWAVETILQEVYQSCKDAREREEFISLLQFCVAIQPSLLDEVYVTMEADRFTMVDNWGNDLQQIYLDTLPKEEYIGAQMHDLLLSILMTMMPKIIHLSIVTAKPSEPLEREQQNFLQFLTEIFGNRLRIEGKNSVE